VHLIIKSNRRRRYIGFEIKSESCLKKSDFIFEIENKWIKKFNEEPRKYGLRLIELEQDLGIIRINYLQKENMIGILNSIKKIKDEKVEITTIATSGTIKSLLKKIL
jgi:RNase P/RNase MRP subunit POP5